MDIDNCDINERHFSGRYFIFFKAKTFKFNGAMVDSFTSACTSVHTNDKGEIIFGFLEKKDSVYKLSEINRLYISTDHADDL
jgi:hypothetical protein